MPFIQCLFLDWSSTNRLRPHVLNVLGIQMRSRLHMQISHVPHTTWLSDRENRLAMWYMAHG